MMRDKLVKTGHRAWYYRFRKMGVFTAFLVAGGLIAIVPARQISIEIQNLHAQQNSEENFHEELVVTTEETTLISNQLLDF